MTKFLQDLLFKGTVTLSTFVGSGTRMVVAGADGKLSTQTIPTSSITGSGTANYAARWLTATTLGDSAIYDNGSIVAIGTASPNAQSRLTLMGSSTYSKSIVLDSTWNYQTSFAMKNGIYSTEFNLGGSTKSTNEGGPGSLQVSTYNSSTGQYRYPITFFANANVSFGGTGSSVPADNGSTVQVNGSFYVSTLAGTGTRMVVASATGVLSTQEIPSGGSGAEADTLDSVTDRGAITTNAISVGGVTATGVTLTSNGNLTTTNQFYGLVTNYTDGIFAGYDSSAVFLGYKLGSTPIHVGTQGTGNVLIRTSGNTIIENGKLLIGTSTDSGYIADFNGVTRLNGKVNIGNLANVPGSVVDILGSNTTAGQNGDLRIRHSATDGNTMLMTFGVSNQGGGGYNQGHGYIQTSYWGGNIDNPIFINPKGTVGIVINHDSYGPGTISFGNSVVAQGSMLIKPSSNTNGGVIKGYGFAANAYNAGFGAFSSGMYGQFAQSGWQNGIDLVFITISGNDVTTTEGLERLRIQNTGEVIVSNLAGTGTRMVVADATGKLGVQAVPSATLTDTLDSVTDRGATTTNIIKVGGIYGDDLATTVFASDSNYFYQDRIGSSGGQGFKIKRYGTDASVWRYDDATGFVDFGNLQNYGVRILTNNVAQVYIHPSGNTTLGGSTDGGYKLQVVGTTRLGDIIHSGNTIYHATAGTQLIIYGRRVQGDSILLQEANVFDHASGTNSLLGINPTVGIGYSANFSAVSVAPVINITTNLDGGNKVRGYYYNPTVTALNGAEHYAFESTAGKIKVSDLSGTGTRMVVADATGKLGVQEVPTLALTDTLDSVTDRGATTTNAITVGGATVNGVVSITSPNGGAIEFYPEGGSNATYSWMRAKLGSGLAPTLAWYGDVGGSYRAYGIYGPDSTYDGLLIYREAPTLADVILMGATKIALPSTQRIIWSSSTNVVDTPDLGLAREAAGLLQINNSSLNTYASLKLLNLTATGLAGSGTRMVTVDNNGLLGAQAIPSGGTGSSTLSGLTDVAITSVANNQLLKYDSGTGKWINWTPNYLTSYSEVYLGTVTSVSVVSANGFAGTVATSTSTPAITISTTVTGILKGNGTAISAAVAGTDYLTSSNLSGYLTSATAASTYQPLDGDLTAIAALSGTSGFLKKTAANTWTLDTNTYLTSYTEIYQGTVTSVAALTLGTTGTDLSSSVATGTTTPVITLNVPTASASNRGALSSTDWSTFNSKQAGSTNLTSLSGLTYASTSFVKMTAAGTFALDTNTYYLASNPSGYTTNTGTVTTVSVTTANGISGTVATAGTTPAITLSLGAITPTSVNSVVISGSSTPTLAVTGTSSISGSNTGDNAVNSLYSGLVSNATHTGDATGATALTVVGLRGVALPALGASAGFLKYTGTGTNTWVFDTSVYLTANQSITLSGAVSGSGTTAITTTLANSVVGVANLSATGTPSASTYLRGDNTWATISAEGGGGYTVTSQTTTYSVTATSGTTIVKGDTTGGTFTITLPTAVGNTATIIIKKTAGSAALVIDGAGTETIDGGLTATINKVYESVTLISDNANWQIV